MFDQLIHVFLQSSWQILLLGLIVWPLSRLSIKAYPNFAYSLWVVILIKALIPINITLPSQQIPVMQISPIITGQFIQTATVPSPAVISTNTLIFIVWMAVVFFLFVKLLVSEISHRNQMKTAEELAPESWFEDMKGTLGIKQKVQIFVNPKIQSPMMQGLWHVRIYLPRRYKSWTSDEQKSVLAHELMHVKRKDIIVIYLQALVRTLYFFHPMVWLVNDQIDLEREKICDDAAIDLAQSDRGAYGHQLFKQLSSLKGGKSTPVLAGGFFMTDSSVIKRFRYIKEKRGNMKNKLKIYHVVMILAVISVALVIACSTDGENELTSPTELKKNTQDAENPLYDSPPIPVGGYADIQNNVVYPESARKAGIGGTTILQASIDKDGSVMDVNILKSGGSAILDTAAITAVLKTEWKPALKLDEPVAMRIALPIVFSLKSGESESTATSAKPIGTTDWDVGPRPENWKAISENIVYPEEAKKAGISGTLTVQFTIDEKGNFIQPKIVNGPDHPALKKAAFEALKSTKWVPAEKDGQTIAATMEIGIGFGSEEEQNMTRQKANGLHPIDKLGKVPVLIKGPNGAARARDVSLKIHITSEGIFDGVGGSISSAEKDIVVDQVEMQKWMDTKWEALPREAKLEAQWIDVPLEFSFED